MNTAVCTALDGAQVAITSDRPLTTDYSSVAQARITALGIPSQGFSTGPLSFAEELATDPALIKDVSFIEEYSYQRGRLRIATGTQPVGPDGAEYWDVGPDGSMRPMPLHVAVWEGKGRSLRTHLYGGEAADLLVILEQFEIAERPRGLTCIPRDPEQASFVEGPSIIKDVPGFALLEIFQLSARTARTLPRHAGTTVSGGELFVDGVGTSRIHLLLVGESAVTWIVPELSASELDLLDGVSRLEVKWS